MVQANEDNVPRPGPGPQEEHKDYVIPIAHMGRGNFYSAVNRRNFYSAHVAAALAQGHTHVVFKHALWKMDYRPDADECVIRQAIANARIIPGAVQYGERDEVWLEPECIKIPIAVARDA